jgi:phage pi2 protein 07
MISRKSFDTWGFQDLHQVWNTESSESINNQLVTPQFSVEG